MKALTISQPFASLIADGKKFVENRSWATSYRGPIAIHAGLGRQYLSKAELAKYPTGCVIATAMLVACVTLSSVKTNAATFPGVKVPGTSVSWQQLLMHEHTEGPFCWVLDDVIKIEPITAKGMQGLWTWDPS